MEHLGRHTEPLRPHGHMIAVPARGFMLFYVLEYSPNSPLGRQSSTSKRVWVNDEWISSRSSPGLPPLAPACNCLGKHVRALWMLYMGELGILTQWDWLPQTGLVQWSRLKIWMWSLWVLLAGEPNSFMVLYPRLGRWWKDLSYFSFTNANGWISVATVHVYTSSRGWDISYEVN